MFHFNITYILPVAFSESPFILKMPLAGNHKPQVIKTTVINIPDEMG